MALFDTSEFKCMCCGGRFESTGSNFPTVKTHGMLYGYPLCGECLTIRGVLIDVDRLLKEEGCE